MTGTKRFLVTPLDKSLPSSIIEAARFYHEPTSGALYFVDEHDDMIARIFNADVQQLQSSKQSSAELSSLAAKYISFQHPDQQVTADIRSLAASVLSQDETPAASAKAKGKK